MTIKDYQNAQALIGKDGLYMSIIKNNPADASRTGFLVLVPASSIQWTAVPMTAASLRDDFQCIPDTRGDDRGGIIAPAVNCYAWIDVVAQIRWGEYSNIETFEMGAQIVQVQAGTGARKRLGYERKLTTGPGDTCVVANRWLYHPGDGVALEVWQDNELSLPMNIVHGYLQLTRVGDELPDPLYPGH